MNQLTRCCCCMSLRAGTIIIGLLYLVGALFSIGVLFAAIAFQFDLPERNSTPFLEVFPVYYVFLALDLKLKVPIVYLLVQSCVQIIIDIILIIGAAKRKVALAVPWLVFNILSLLSNQLGIIAFCVGGYPSSPTFNNFGFITPLVVTFFYLTFGIYTMDAVNRFYESGMHRYVSI